MNNNKMQQEQLNNNQNIDIISMAKYDKEIVSTISESIKAVSELETPLETTPKRLCGGIFVAIPTAIPALPLTKRFGRREGKTVGSCERPS